MTDTKAILAQSAHRPWQLPTSSWLMFQSWQRQLFAHWAVHPGLLRGLLPPELELDEFDGMAYVGVTPFDLRHLHFHLLPPLPIGSNFPEVNLRTYVRFGGKPGVFFFSLDAASQIAVIAARTTFGLPYFAADMNIAECDGWTEYRSKRSTGDAELDVRYRPDGPVFTAMRGTLDHFLIERYALYVVPRSDTVMRGDIHHAPWQLQRTAAELNRNTIPAAHGIALPSAVPILHYSARQDTLLWPLAPASRTNA